MGTSAIIINTDFHAHKMPRTDPDATRTGPAGSQTRVSVDTVKTIGTQTSDLVSHEWLVLQ